MQIILPFFILVPLMGFLATLLIPKSKENAISVITFTTLCVQHIASIVLTGYWMLAGQQIINIKELVIYKTKGYEFFIDLYFDKITAVYLLLGSLLTFLITIYSRYYLHREVGYKRFFNTILFFFTGYNLTILSGNFETLFIGWEILGVTSFLLIAFYRHRYLPVKNAVKVFSIYRIGDIGLIIAMWLSHHLWHSNITFLELNNYGNVEHHLHDHSNIGLFISIMVLIAATVKSAQFPFSSWLPRAMEGPTPSSAIYYSSLSVHIGVFMLIRTYPFWEHQTSIRILVALLGLISSVLATCSSKVQSSIKSQIAYSSIAQIGLIFIEIAAGWETLALIHIAGNAFLRTYQLLVSPSAVTYLIREQFFNFIPKVHKQEPNWIKRIKYTIYILSLKEWNLDSFMYHYLWKPVKILGSRLNFLNVKILLLLFTPLFLSGVFFLFNEGLLPAGVYPVLPTSFAFIGLTMVAKSFTERKNVNLGWLLIILNHFWIALAVSFNERFSFSHTAIYLSGVIVSGIVGYLCLLKLERLEKDVDLTRFQGHSYEHPSLALIFFLACLGLAGFPITTTFLGEDLIFSHIHENQLFLIVFVSLSFLIDGLALIRIYARVFLGPHTKTYHTIAHRSS